MDRQTAVRITEYLTLAIMAVCTALYLYGDQDIVWPCVIVFAVAAWIHGICWGYLLARRGRLSWF